MIRRIFAMSLAALALIASMAFAQGSSSPAPAKPATADSTGHKAGGMHKGKKGHKGEKGEKGEKGGKKGHKGGEKDSTGSGEKH
jgi:hypothetical protein